MNDTDVDPFESLFDALEYVHLTSGLHINESLLLHRSHSKWSSLIGILPLVLGFVGFTFNILAILIFTASKTFRENSFRCYIYAFVLVNCVSILTHSWLYLIFYLVNPFYLCRYLQYFQQSTATTSLWIMVLLSVERSFAFSRPFAVRKLFQTRTTCFILVFVTLLCFILHIDELISVDIKAFRWVNFAYGLCSVKRHFHLLTERIEIVTHSHSFILPFLFNSVLDVYICYKICQRRKRLIVKTRLIISKKKKNSRRARKSLAHEITITLLCQSMWLLLTYFPTHLYYFLISFKLINDHDRDNSSLNVLMRLNLLVYLAFSPTLYVILSPTLRKEIHSYVSRSYKRRQSVNLSTLKKNFGENPSHQQRNSSQMNVTILISTSEQAPRKILAKSMSVPFHIQYLTESVPRLLLCNEEEEDEQNAKAEPYNT